MPGTAPMSVALHGTRVVRMQRKKKWKKKWKKTGRAWPSRAQRERTHSIGTLTVSFQMAGTLAARGTAGAKGGLIRSESG